MCMDGLSITCIYKIDILIFNFMHFKDLYPHIIERNLGLGTLMYPEQANTAALAL